MPNLMPGAKWRPIPVGNRPRRTKGRGVCLHVAVSESPSLFGFFSSAAVDSHFYVAKDGTIEQYVDADLVAYANLGGNGSLISVETQGGVTNPEGERWTGPQLSSLAAIARWAHDSEGVPLQAMPDSRPTSRGIGWHKLGVSPWIVPGGETWSSAYGKTCPGAAKIAQVPAIVLAARAPSPTGGDDMPLSDDDIEKVAQRTRQVIADGTLRYGLDNLRARLEALSAAVAVKDDPTALAQAIVAALPKSAAELTVDDVKTAVREVLGSLDSPGA